MAQDPNKQPPLRNQQSISEEFHQLSDPPSAFAESLANKSEATLQFQKKQVGAPIKASSSDRDSGRFTRSSIQRVSRTSITRPLDANTKVPALSAQQSQFSKVFKTKCQAELKALLEAIKPDFHEEIRRLYIDELHPDLYLKIGNEDLQKPYHKCVIASRACKFYSLLKAFRQKSEESKEKDIFVNDCQDHILNFQIDNQTDDDKEAAGLRGKKINEERLREALEVVKCELPENLVSPELLLNFIRRTYLDQDLHEEETRLRELTINWFKVNKPELIKQPARRRNQSPDSRGSFRTIQPDLERLSIASGSMSANEQSSSDLAKPSLPTDFEVTEDGGHESRADSQLTSLLTRTETFELLSKSNPDSCVVELDVDRKHQGLDEDDERDRSTVSGSLNDSEASEVYTPVTRTGLKPKQFNTPVGIKVKKTPTASARKAESQGSEVDRSGSSLTKSIGLVRPTTKASSQPQAATPKTPTHSKAQPQVTPAKVRQTIIARAHPISLERSQSPGTGFSKGSTKNFIAANKKTISQIERKVIPTKPQGDHQANMNEDSENEVSDASLLALSEPLTTDTLAAQVEKFSLVSQSKLAEALSRMLIQEIMTDALVLTQHNKQISAHRCILAARSAYLSDQISQQCLPSLTTESPSKQLIRIDLTDHSYPAVYFALMHIYSGIVKVPEDVELEDLTRLSHVLHVATLRQVCMHSLRMNYCHYFHKPCNVCCIGVLKTLPLAWRYDLTDLYSKCLSWIGTHFAQIFCLEEFANLKPNDLIEECYKETLTQLTPDNVIQKTVECQKLLKSLPRVKWTESIICLVGRQLEDFCHYVADNYEKILQSESFLNLGRSCWECEVLEENLLAAMNHLRPDSGCKTLIQLDKIECSIDSYLNEPKNVSDNFVNLISKMRKYCERYLLKEAPAVVHCSSWRQMNPALQKRIKDQALLSTDFDEPTKHLASKPKLPSMARHQHTSRTTPSPQPNNSGNNSGNEARSPSNRSTPDPRLRSTNTTYLPPPKNKPAAARHVKVLK